MNGVLVLTTMKRKGLAMESNEIKALLLYISVGMRVLSSRVVLLVTLILAFMLFAWAMYLPGYERIAAATLFTLLVFLPVIRMDGKLKKDRETIEGD